MQTTRELRLAVANQLAEVARATGRLDELWEELRIEDDLRADLNIAAEEMLSNVVRHSGLPEGEHITMRVAALPESIEMEIQDAGRPFNPLEHPMPDPKAPLEERRGGGLGIFMVVNMMDQVEYERREGRNCLRMVRKRA